MVNVLKREPVLFGAAITATADGVAWFYASQEAQTILHAIVLAWVALIVRSFSTPTAKAADDVEAARYVGGVEKVASDAAARALARPRRAPIESEPAGSTEPPAPGG